MNIPTVAWNWGPAMIILIGLFLLIRGPLQGIGGGIKNISGAALTSFLESQHDQSQAMLQQASAMNSQAGTLEELSKTIKDQREVDHLCLQIMRNNLTELTMLVKARLKDV